MFPAFLRLAFAATALLAMSGRAAGEEASFHFSAPAAAEVRIAAVGELLVIDCRFAPQRALPDAENRRADRAEAGRLTIKALAQYFKLKPGQRLQLGGLEPEFFAISGGRVQARFRIGSGACRILGANEESQ